VREKHSFRADARPFSTGDGNSQPAGILSKSKLKGWLDF